MKSIRYSLKNVVWVAGEKKARREDTSISTVRVFSSIANTVIRSM